MGLTRMKQHIANPIEAIFHNCSTFKVNIWCLSMSPLAGWDADGKVVGPDWDVSRLGALNCRALSTVLRLTCQEVL